MAPRMIEKCKKESPSARHILKTIIFILRVLGGMFPCLVSPSDSDVP